MTKILAIHHFITDGFFSKKSLVTFVIALVVGFVFVSVAQANESTESASVKKEPPQKYGITFPVADLGNCATLPACKVYCDSTLHREECVAFAKKKGFYQEKMPPAKQKIASEEAKLRDAKMQELLALAKSELGCESEDTCKARCELIFNRDKCKALAQKINGKANQGGPAQNSGQKPPQKPQSSNTNEQKILEKLKSAFSCDSLEACKQICYKPENQEKCRKIVDEVTPPPPSKATTTSGELRPGKFVPPFNASGAGQPGVQGVSTKNFIQKILDFIF